MNENRVVIARKPSSDPSQEVLREHKSQWNRAVSDFIDRSRERRLTTRLIALKRALNGHPVPELNLGKGNIKEPLPDVISQILDNLAAEYQQMAGEFSQLSNAGKTIVQEQGQYSQTRRKSSPPVEQMTQQPVQASNDYNLIKEASNPLTRLWTYMATPFRFGDKDRFARKNMLQTAAEIEKRLGEIGTAILTYDDNSIPKVVLYSKDLVHLYNVGISEPLIALNNAKAEENGTSEKEQEIPDYVSPSVPAKTPEYTEIKTVQLNTEVFNQYLKSKVSKDVDDFNKYVEKYPQVVGVVLGKLPDGSWEAVNIETRQEVLEEQAPPIDLGQDGEVDVIDMLAGWQKDFNKKHQYLESWVIPTFNTGVRNKTLSEEDVRLMKETFSLIEKAIVDFQISIDNRDNITIVKEKYDNFNNLYDLILETAKKISVAEQDDIGIKKVAQNRLSRWFKRQWVDLLKRRDYQLRLTAEKVLMSAEQSLGKLMNVLEMKKAPIHEVNKLAIEFATHMVELLRNIVRLADNHNNVARMKYYRARSEGDRTVVNFINRTDLTEINRMINNLDGLKKFIENKENKEEERIAG